MRRLAAGFAAFALIMAAAAQGAVATTPAFSNTPLIATTDLPAGVTTQPNANSSGDSEPAIAFGPNGRMVVDGLAWLPFAVNMWTGSFGSTPSYFGAMDTTVPHSGAGRIGLGDGDADVEVTSAGTILLTDLDFFVNRPFNNASLGVSITRCPVGATTKADCATRVLDQAGADRPWLTVSGTSAWLSYHDSGSSSLVHVLRSTDDGRTWATATSPIPGNGKLTGNATFNNENGPIVAGPGNNLYDIYAAGEAGIQKGSSANFNNVFVAHSTDGGRTWTQHLVHHAPLFTALNNIFPALAVDPTDGHLYAAWSDLHGVWVSTSTDHAATWSAPAKVSSAATVVMPWVAARSGTVHVVYYGTSASSIDDSSAVWNVYDSIGSGGSWSTELVSNTPNRVGAVCLEGSACSGDRELLDLFEVAVDPGTGKAAVIYTDTTIDTYTDDSGTHELPEIVLAFEQ